MGGRLPFVAVLDSTIVHESVRGLGLQRLFHEIKERKGERVPISIFNGSPCQNHASINNLETAGFTRQFTRTMYGGKERHCYAKRLNIVE